MVRPSKFRLLLPSLLDIVVPTLGFFLLRASGLKSFWALAISGIAAGIVAIVNTAKRKRLDALGLLVVIEVVVSIALLFLARDPKILLLRPSAYAVVTGIYFLSTLPGNYPFMFTAAKPMATKGDPVRAEAYERAWRRSAQFRFLQRKLTAVWGLALLAEAALRSVVVLRMPLDRAVIWAHAPAIAAVILAGMYTRHLIPSLRKIVNAEEQQVRESKL